MLSLILWFDFKPGTEEDLLSNTRRSRSFIIGMQDTLAWTPEGGNPDSTLQKKKKSVAYCKKLYEL